MVIHFWESAAGGFSHAGAFSELMYRDVGARNVVPSLLEAELV